MIDVNNFKRMFEQYIEIVVMSITNYIMSDKETYCYSKKRFLPY